MCFIEELMFVQYSGGLKIKRVIFLVKKRLGAKLSSIWMVFEYSGDESLFLGFLKEDLFYFSKWIFQDFLFFIYLYRIVLFLADITSVACLKQFLV